MPDAIRRLDTTSHGASVTTGSGNVTIGGLPAARFNDSISNHQKHRHPKVAQGSGRVRVGGRPLAFAGALTSCRATLVAGQSKVTVGSSAVTARTISQLNTHTLAQSTTTKIGDCEL